MADAQITLRVDEQDPAAVTVQLVVDGQHVTTITADPAAWRQITAPARAVLGEPAETALAAAETAIRDALAARAKESAAAQRKYAAAVKAWAPPATTA